MDGICITKKEFRDFMLLISYRVLSLEQRLSDLKFGLTLAIDSDCQVELVSNFMDDIFSVNDEIFSLKKQRAELCYRFERIRD